jgi:glycine/D-amino acid oxidase-like deaminating enzyme
MTKFDIAIVGGGLVGAALAFGLRDSGGKLALLDEGDIAHRAARGNFGLVWVQGKGAGMPQYGAWTQQSAREWPRLAAQLLEATGIDVALRQPGGLHVCLSQEELEARERHLRAVVGQPGFPDCPIEVLDRGGAAARVGDVGPDVAGATYCPLDGECNPLRLLRALHAGVSASGCTHLRDHRVTHVERAASGFVLRTARGDVRCERVVLAAGLGNATLAPMAGLEAPVTPNKGQIIVLERVPPFLRMPLSTLRQTDEGTVLIGDSQQDAGFDESLGLGVLSTMAQRATRVFPALREVRAVRAWAALRVMSPDGCPIYACDRGAWTVNCHSGVTLAAVHASTLAAAIRDDAMPAACAAFAPSRFHVDQAA